MTDTNLNELAAKLAAILGGTAKPDEDNRWPDITTARGPRLDIQRKDGKRLRIALCYPHYKDFRGNASYISTNDFLNYDEREKEIFTTSIMVAADKSPEVIARDIERRLMPDAVKLHARALQYCADKEKYQADYIATVRYLAKETNSGVPDDGDRIVRIHSGPDLHVSSPRNVRIERLDVSPALAVEIIKLIKKSKEFA